MPTRRRKPGRDLAHFFLFNFHIKTRTGISLPLFGLLIFLVLVAMGWGLWELNRIWDQQTHDQTTFQATLHQRLGEQLKDFQNRLTAQEDRWTGAWQNQAVNQSNVLKSFFDMQMTTKLREGYLSVAERLQADAPEIQQALLRYAATTNAVDLDLQERKRQELKDWLRALRVHLDTERLISRSQELITNGTNSVSIDLGSLCREVENRLTNYLAKADLICTLARNPAPTSLKMNEEIAGAGKQFAGLMALAEQAPAAAGKTDLSLPPPASPAAEFKREMLETEKEARALAAPPAVKDYSTQLQAVFYALLGSIFGLSLFLITAIYRRVVVERLRSRLRE